MCVCDIYATGDQEDVSVLCKLTALSHSMHGSTACVYRGCYGLSPLKTIYKYISLSLSLYYLLDFC